MPTLSIRVSEELKKRLFAHAKGQHRKPSEQLRRYLEIAIIADENRDLPFSFIENILEAQAEIEAGLLEELDRNQE